MQNGEAYITVKDHKENFPEKVAFRLINPSKSEIGKLSKKLLDGINKELRAKVDVNQWKNTSEVINWFNNIRNKNECSFVCFDIENFYPSISPELLDKSIQFAKEHTNISADDLYIILQSRKTLLFHNKEQWVKKGTNEDFDVPMGCYDGAEVCELVGIYILNQLGSLPVENNIGLYRDDGLGVLRNCTGRQSDLTRKKIIKIFKDNGLNIVIRVNQNVVNFLDVTFDLQKGTYMPYMKPKNSPAYINALSNHPPSIKTSLIKSISKRLSTISYDLETFEKSTKAYQEALTKSGFKEKLEFQNSIETRPEEQTRRKNRKRKIIWFNPPYSESVKSNIGRQFLNLISRHFPTQNKLNKIFNKNTVKVSYSCMKNVGAIISSHNKNLLHPRIDQSGCNCQNKSGCPLNSTCLTPKIIYLATITNNIDDEKKFYIGISEPPFKVRWKNHCRDCNFLKYRTSTELSKYFWDLKDNGKNAKIEWSCLKNVYGRSCASFCRLCLEEKLHILEFNDQENLLNKRSEFVNKCRHQNKYLLKNAHTFDSND